ncbi:hypothetical protein [Paenarthrobacter sp. YIM B13468]|uniref:hypothetical protein n=1 Tax=Paenarthrobacter sp. YIM B13468 TaxID=3366295 RepID=UPI00366FBF45
MAVNQNTVVGTLTIGAAADLTNFSSQLTSIKLVTSSDTSDPVPVLSGETVAGEFSETQTLEGTMFQDLGTASKMLWLYDNAGETHVFEFIPSTAAGKKFTGSLVVASPAEIGGDAKSKPTTDISFQVIGKAVAGDVA